MHDSYVLGVSVEDFVKNKLARKESYYLGDEGDFHRIQLKLYTVDGDLRTIVESRVYKDGRVEDFHSDIAEGGEFILRHKFLLSNVSITKKGYCRIHKLGWE
jgi:hypothetical protein